MLQSGGNEAGRLLEFELIFCEKKKKKREKVRVEKGGISMVRVEEDE